MKPDIPSSTGSRDRTAQKATTAQAIDPQPISPVIGVLSNRNLRSPWASTHYYAAAALRRGGAKVLHVAEKFVQSANARGLFSELGRRLGGGRREAFDFDAYHAEIVHDLRRTKYDALLALHSSTLAPALEHTTHPVIYVTDATADLLQGYYPERAKLTETELRGIHEGERRVISRADRVCVPSQWVADSVIDRYHADPIKVSVVEWGANLEHFPSPPQPTPPKAGEPIRLLFVGLDWRRKGADIAVRATDLLNQAGIPAQLTVVGAQLPADLQRPYVTAHGQVSRMSRTGAQTLDRLMRDATLLIHPARAECYGHVLCEAMAFGTPPIATDTGGISQCIRHGETGMLLPPGAAPQEFADCVRRVVSDANGYVALCERAATDFRGRLNWDRWASSVLDLVSEVRDPPATG